jgi:hypothetical protein
VSDEGSSRREILAGAALLVLGVGARLAFVLEVPNVAFSDFRALVDFGLAMGRGGWAVESWHWIQFNPGLPMALSFLFAFFPDPETTARHATAGLTGLLPLFPFLLWRGVVALRWRFVTGLFLALWPGQIFFSGVVAQENWALLPAVALGALAVRVVRAEGKPALPLAGGLLLAAAAAFRQEMLVVLLPAAFAAAGLFRTDSKRPARAALLVLAAGAPLLGLAWQRHVASGRFTITTEHGGLALLGSVVPGAAKAGWTDPRAYIAALQPELLENRTAARREAGHLALKEWKRRPAFHLLRSASVSGRLAVESDADSLFWSVGSPQALPAELRSRGAELYARWFPRLRWELAIIQGLFAASVLGALRRRDTAILVLAACILLKFAVQSAASPLGRLMFPATALELLAIGLSLSVPATGRSRFRDGLVAVGVAAVLLLIEPRLSALAVAKDEPPLRVERFPLEITGGGIARCTVEEGEVTSLEWRRAWLRPVGEGKARVSCSIPDGSNLVARIEPEQAAAQVSIAAEMLEIALHSPGAMSIVPSDPGQRPTR